MYVIMNESMKLKIAPRIAPRNVTEYPTEP